MEWPYACEMGIKNLKIDYWLENNTIDYLLNSCPCGVLNGRSKEIQIVLTAVIAWLENVYVFV